MKLVIGNQKAYLKRDEVLDFIEKTKNYDCSETIICPSSVYLDLYLDKSNYIVGSQDVGERPLGATTGEISADQLNSIGVAYSLVGHSERRKNQHETGPMLINKITRLFENDITPILCIGETQEEKELNVTKDVIGKQIMEVFDGLDQTKLEKIIIAYEPIWSIGTGLIPTNEEIEDTITYIKDLIVDKYDKRVAVLYGGSVNKGNIDELNKIDLVDGYLIGGASTKVEEFLYIMSKCE